MIKQFVVLSALVLACTLAAHAQESNSDSTQTDQPAVNQQEWTVTALGSYGMHDVDFNSLPPIENCCLGFENSNGIGYGLQLGGSFPLTDGGLRLSARLGYMLVPVEYSSFSSDKVYVQGTGTVDAVFKHTLHLSFNTIPLHVSLEYPLADWLWFGAGPDAYYIASTSFHQLESLESPKGYQFENGSSTRIDTTSALKSYNSMVFNVHGSLRIRLGKDIGSINGIDLLLAYSHPLTSVFDPQTWQGVAGSPVRSYYINRYNLSMLTAGIAVAF